MCKNTNTEISETHFDFLSVSFKWFHCLKSNIAAEEFAPAALWMRWGPSTNHLQLQTETFLPVLNTNMYTTKLGWAESDPTWETRNAEEERKRWLREKMKGSSGMLRAGYWCDGAVEGSMVGLAVDWWGLTLDQSCHYQSKTAKGQLFRCHKHTSV